MKRRRIKRKWERSRKRKKRKILTAKAMCPAHNDQWRAMW